VRRTAERYHRKRVSLRAGPSASGQMGAIASVVFAAGATPNDGSDECAAAAGREDMTPIGHIHADLSSGLCFAHLAPNPTDVGGWAAFNGPKLIPTYEKSPHEPTD